MRRFLLASTVAFVVLFSTSGAKSATIEELLVRQAEGCRQGVQVGLSADALLDLCGYPTYAFAFLSLQTDSHGTGPHCRGRGLPVIGCTMLPGGPSPSTNSVFRHSRQGTPPPHDPTARLMRVTRLLQPNGGGTR